MLRQDNRASLNTNCEWVKWFCKHPKSYKGSFYCLNRLDIMVFNKFVNNISISKLITTLLKINLNINLHLFVWIVRFWGFDSYNSLLNPTIFGYIGWNVVIIEYWGTRAMFLVSCVSPIQRGKLKELNL